MCMVRPLLPMLGTQENNALVLSVCLSICVCLSVYQLKHKA